MKKRKDGRYLRTKDYDDGRGRQYFYGATEDEVIDLQRKYEQSLKQTELDKTKFSYWSDAWWDVHQTEIKYNTAECYKKPLEDLKEEFDTYALSEILPTNIKNFYLNLRDRGYAHQTIKLRKIVLSQIYDFAIESDLLISNIAKVVQLPKNLPTTKRCGVSAADVKKIQSSSELYPNFLLYTGCRRNEALAIKWKNIDFKNNTIKIEDAIVWVENKPTFDTGTKSDNGQRIIPLLSPLKKLLFPVRKKSGYVFNIDGKPLEKKQAITMWNRFKKQYDLQITAHELRHTFITNMFYSGIDVKTAQGIAGHSKVETMLNIYTELQKGNQDESRKKLEQFMGM